MLWLKFNYVSKMGPRKTSIVNNVAADDVAPCNASASAVDVLT